MKIVFALLVAALQMPLPMPSRSASPSPKPTATPNPYRELKFGTPTLGGEPMGNVTILGAWVAVRRDGRGAHACISFKNDSTVAAKRILFEFPLMNHSGAQVTVLKLDRRGTFSPGIDIHGWDSLRSWQSGSNRGYDENCTGTNVAVAAFPLLQARTATYRIRRIEYADGTVWTPKEGELCRYPAEDSRILVFVGRHVHAPVRIVEDVVEVLEEVVA